MLFIINRFSDLIHHISESLYPFTKALCIPLFTQSPWQLFLYFILYFCKFDFLIIYLFFIFYL